MVKREFRPPTSRVDDNKCVQLSGNWNLITRGTERKRLREELKKLESPRLLVWDLRDITVLDSGGALLLWEIWGKQYPDEVRCRPDQRHWFERIKNTPEPQPPARDALLMRPLLALGSMVLSLGRAGWGVILLIGQLILDCIYCFAHPRSIPWTEISATIYRTGATSMLLLGMVGFLIGIVMAIQIGIDIEQFGAGEMIINLLGLAILRELGAIITAIIVAGRSGAATTAGIAAMQITEEYNALRTFGSSPTLRLVLPRVIGMSLSVPLLTLWTEVWAVIGGSFSAQSELGVDQALFFARLPVVVPSVNFWIGLGKGWLYGLTIALVASYFGLRSQANTESLSRHTTTSVVTSLTLILVMDAILGALMTGIGMNSLA